MLIKNVNFKDWSKNLEVDPKWKPPVTHDFVDRVVAAFAASKPIKDRQTGMYSMQQTMQHIMNAKSDILGISYKNFSDLVLFMYNTNRSKVLTRPQNAEPKYGQLTPLFMYAHKFYNDIPYEKWDRSDPGIKFALGKNLNPVLKYKNPGEFDLAETRKDALTQKSDGKVMALTSNKMSITRINDKAVPKCALYMLLQTWICNVSLRIPDVMILDPENWDKTPDALDIGVPKEEKKEGISDLEVPWL